VLVRRESEIGIQIAQLLQHWSEKAMTAIERWKKGSLQAIGVMLIIALFDYFFPNPPLNQTS
jgi:hypothetical protein